MNMIAAHQLSTGNVVQFVPNRHRRGNYTVVSATNNGSGMTLVMQPPYNGSFNTVTVDVLHFTPFALVK